MNSDVFNIDVIKILKTLNLTYNDRGENYQLVCPNPYHHDSDHDGGSFYIHKKELVFNCFGCDWKGSIFTFLMLYLNLSFDEVVQWLKEKGNFFFNSKEFLKTEIGKRIEAQVKIETVVEKNPFLLPKLVDISSKRILAFFTKRHISKEIAFQYGARMCYEGFYKNRIIIPILEKKNLLGFEARIINKEFSPIKCLYPPNSQLKKTIFDLDSLDKTKELYFTEGMMDCLSLKSRGYLNSSCGFGCKLTTNQIKILNKFKKIVVLPDCDSAGNELVGTFYEKIKIPDIYICTLPDKDVDECEDNELNGVISNKNHITDYIVDRYLKIKKDIITPQELCNIAKRKVLNSTML